MFSNREDCYAALLQRTSERLHEQVAGKAAQALGNIVVRRGLVT